MIENVARGGLAIAGNALFLWFDSNKGIEKLLQD